jgi:glycerate kinase
MGKAPVGVARMAQQHGIPVLCIAGALGEGADDVLAKGIEALASVVPRAMALEECMARGAELVEEGTARACRLVRLGMQLG